MRAIRIAIPLMFVAVAAMTLLAGCGETGGGGQMNLAPPREPSQAVSTLVLPKGDTGTLAEGSFVTKWLVLGPFQFAADDFGGDQQQGSADKEFMPNEAALDGTQKAPQGVQWQEVQFKGDKRSGQVNLDTLYNKIEHAAAYAVAWLHCPQEIKDAKILVGSDDYIKVWLNGKLVHAYSTVRRSSDCDQDTITGITLQKGYNRVVVKCVDVVFDWDFFFRLTDKDGRQLTVAPK